MTSTPPKRAIDYSLYLVTGRDLLPSGKVYSQAILGGVTVVQVREKDADTGEFLTIARATKTICDKHNIPVIINDRVDIAIAIRADGVHLGQTDMSVEVAKKLLPPTTVIGVSVNNVNQAKKAVEDGVDYVGIGAVWDTKTKKLVQPVVGVRNVGELLDVFAVGECGIKTTNLLRTLHGSVSISGYGLDGVAVVSEIVASREPREVAKELKGIVMEFKSGLSMSNGLLFSTSYLGGPVTKENIVEGVVELMKRVRELNPLVHQITNNVVATQSANVTLAIGGSPIMATAPQEMEDLAKICNSFLVNIGTLTTTTQEAMMMIGQYANLQRKPVVLDPVGIGATQYRKNTVNELLDTWQATVIKGNAGEIAAIAGSSEVASKGVDSVGVGFKDPASAVQRLARREKSIVVMTGPVDYISDGITTISLHNGNELLGKITGSGCITGSCITTYCGVAASVPSSTGGDVPGRMVKGDMLLGAVAGILVLTIAAELAVERGNVRGPGTFLPSLIDELWTLDTEEVRKRAKVVLHST
ncbi:thiamine biosynthetic bifunctional enzyme Thi4 [Pluteus cervinus]|uniref:Thiamine biosynthetic bifunctional enzyme Thi4 n=1 Tax=Pluteus cervinus TaxID=181527 RepID=A0ACD3B801_9AGAR|nr:thiamine biosynthetic bifunctional enzyme Thi4 [Pluteus cervinus]